METLLIFVGGLATRLLLFVLLFALFAMPIAALIALAEGATALRRRAAGTVDAGGARWKPGLCYTAAHTWVKRLWGHKLRVGLDDVARRILSGATSLTLPAAGTRLRRGDSLVVARCGNRLVTIPSPVDGIVLERNRALMAEPQLFAGEPYGEGWMLRMETGDRPRGVRGAASRAWLRDESLRWSRFVEARLGMAAADGGTLTEAPFMLLDDESWRETVRSFLRQG